MSFFSVCLSPLSPLPDVAWSRQYTTGSTHRERRMRWVMCFYSSLPILSCCLWVETLSIYGWIYLELVLLHTWPTSVASGASRSLQRLVPLDLKRCFLNPWINSLPKKKNDLEFSWVPTWFSVSSLWAKGNCALYLQPMSWDIWCSLNTIGLEAHPVLFDRSTCHNSPLVSKSVWWVQVCSYIIRAESSGLCIGPQCGAKMWLGAKGLAVLSNVHLQWEFQGRLLNTAMFWKECNSGSPSWALYCQLAV